MIAHVPTRKIKHVLLALALACAPLSARAQDAAHAFDVEFGASSVVNRVWGGAANLGEIDAKGPAGRIQGMSLRLYEPASGQWYVRFANARTGELGEPMIGGFENGRGEFYNQETLDGRP